MMGARIGGQDRLFYEFCLDDIVPADHLLRRIDAVFDLDWLRDELVPFGEAKRNLAMNRLRLRGLTGA